MKITIVTTMRNEGAHLLEWIAHHRAIGVTGFLVYTNDCEDDTEALLSLLPDVTVIPQQVEKKTPQWTALKAAWSHELVKEADWLTCIDCDEFINLNSSIPSLPDLIDHVEGDAILLPWRLFGHANRVNLSNGMTIDRFKRAAAEDMLYPAIGSYFKTLFRRQGPFRQFGVHRPKQKSAERHPLPEIVDGSGHPVSKTLRANDGQIMNWGAPIARDLVQLNHYSLRSAADFMVKRSRGLPNHQDKDIGLTYWVERNFNTVEEETIEHMKAGTQAVLDEFAQIDGVAATLAACRDWQRRRFSELMKDEPSLKLYGRLLLAGSSTHIPNDAARDLVAAYQRLSEHD